MLGIACNTLSRYLSNCSFDGHAVIPVTVLSDQTNSICNDHGKLQTFIDVSVRKLNHNKEMKTLQRSHFNFFQSMLFEGRMSLSFINANSLSNVDWNVTIARIIHLKLKKQ